MIHKPYHTPHIRTGSKTVTRRNWKPGYGPRIGSVQMVKTADMLPEDADPPSPLFVSHEDCDCYVQVMDKYRQPLGEMTDEDAQKEGPYETVDEFKSGWERINGEGSWDPDHVVTVVEYEYVGEDIPSITRRMMGCPNCPMRDDFAVALELHKGIVLGDVDPEVWVCEYHRQKMNDEARELFGDLEDAHEAGEHDHEPASLCPLCRTTA